MKGDHQAERRRLWVFIVMAVVLAAQLWLVAAAGTDIPYQDQWDVEGKWLYPACHAGTWHWADLFRAHNEHRIAWTHATNLLLFTLNGQWDPLVQLVFGAGLRALVAGVLLARLLRGVSGWRCPVVCVAVTVAFLPQLAWQNALWGFQSQVYFVLLFSLLALNWLGKSDSGWQHRALGCAAGMAALVAMGAGAFVPFALFGLVGLRWAERRSWTKDETRVAVPALGLLVLALALRVDVPAHTELHAASVGRFAATAVEILAWPHVDVPLAALVLNLPVLIAVAMRLLRRRTAAPGEDYVLLVAGWTVLIAMGAAWARGGGDEFVFGVPSRYVDFFTLLPLANVWCALALIPAVRTRRPLAVTGGLAWAAFLVVGWAGLSAQHLRRVVVPRAELRDLPVQRMREFQATDDPRLLTELPYALRPHPDVASVRAVLQDPRMAGALPPSLQPEHPRGPLSRAVRWLLWR